MCACVCTCLCLWLRLRLRLRLREVRALCVRAIMLDSGVTADIPPQTFSPKGTSDDAF